MSIKGQSSNFVLIILGIFAVAATIFFYLNQSQKSNEMELVSPTRTTLQSQIGPFPGTNDAQLNSILGTTNNNFGLNINAKWAQLRCPVDKGKSLVNLVHIRKNGNSYEIDCQFGPYYNNIDYSIDGESHAVYGGWVSSRRCDEEVARAIDKAVREVYNCEFPIYKELSTEVQEYYAFYFACGPVFESIMRQKACFAPVQSRLHGGFRGVIIPATGEFIL